MLGRTCDPLHSVGFLKASVPVKNVFLSVEGGKREAEGRLISATQSKSN